MEAEDKEERPLKRGEGEPRWGKIWGESTFLSFRKEMSNSAKCSRKGQIGGRKRPLNL